MSESRSNNAVPDEELIGVLTAISVVSKRLARKLIQLDQTSQSQEGGKPDQKQKVKRRRLRTVIDNLIRFATHVTSHARYTSIALGRSNVWRFAFMQLWKRFAAC